MPRPATIRIVLDTDDGKPIYWPMDQDGDDGKPLSAKKALDYLRQGVPFIVAIADPQDDNSHYESTDTHLLHI